MNRKQQQQQPQPSYESTLEGGHRGGEAPLIGGGHRGALVAPLRKLVHFDTTFNSNQKRNPYDNCILNINTPLRNVQSVALKCAEIPYVPANIEVGANPTINFDVFYPEMAIPSQVFTNQSIDLQLKIANSGFTPQNASDPLINYNINYKPLTSLLVSVPVTAVFTFDIVYPAFFNTAINYSVPYIHNMLDVPYNTFLDNFFNSFRAFQAVHFTGFSPYDNTNYVIPPDDSTICNFDINVGTLGIIKKNNMDALFLRYALSMKPQITNRNLGGAYIKLTLDNNPNNLSNYLGFDGTEVGTNPTGTSNNVLANAPFSLNTISTYGPTTTITRSQTIGFTKTAYTLADVTSPNSQLLNDIIQSMNNGIGATDGLINYEPNLEFNIYENLVNNQLTPFEAVITTYNVHNGYYYSKSTNPLGQYQYIEFEFIYSGLANFLGLQNTPASGILDNFGKQIINFDSTPGLTINGALFGYQTNQLLYSIPINLPAASYDELSLSAMQQLATDVNSQIDSFIAGYTYNSANETGGIVDNTIITQFSIELKLSTPTNPSFPYYKFYLDVNNINSFWGPRVYDIEIPNNGTYFLQILGYTPTSSYFVGNATQRIIYFNHYKRLFYTGNVLNTISFRLPIFNVSGTFGDVSLLLQAINSSLNSTMGAYNPVYSSMDQYYNNFVAPDAEAIGLFDIVFSLNPVTNKVEVTFSLKTPNPYLTNFNGNKMPEFIVLTSTPLIGNLGFTGNEIMSNTNNTTQQKIQFDNAYDNPIITYINLYLSNIPAQTTSANGLNTTFKIPLTSSNQILSNSNSGQPIVGYFFSEENSLRQKVELRDRHFVCDKIVCNLTDRSGYTLTSLPLNYSFTLEFEVGGD